MNRKEYNELLDEVLKEVTEENGNFQTLYGGNENTVRDAKFIAAVSILAVDRYYAKLTRLKHEHPDIF